MKFLKNKPSPKAFIPFELTIRVENKRDLELLWCIANSSISGLVMFLNDNISGVDIKRFHKEQPEVKFIQDELYPILDEEIQ